jgi:hypothetical protein
MCAGTVGAIENTQYASLGPGIGRRLCHLTLRVQVRAIYGESYRADDEYTQSHHDKQYCLPGFISSLSSRYFQYAITP